MDTDLLTQDMIDILMQLSAEIQKARKNEENAALDTTCLPKTLISNPEPQSFRKPKLPYVSFTFLSHKINFVTLCFRPFYQKKKIFFEKPRNFQFFMCFGPRRSFYEKSSGVWRPASCGQNLDVENFNFK